MDRGYRSSSDHSSQDPASMSIVVLSRDSDQHAAQGHGGIRSEKFDFSHLDLPTQEVGDPSANPALPQYEMKMDDVLNLVSECDREIQRLRAENEELTTTLKENNAQVPLKLVAVKENLQTKYSESLATMKKKVQMLQNEMVAKDEKMKELQAKMPPPTSSADEEQEKMASLEQKVHQLEQQRHQLVAQKDDLEHQLQHKIAELREANGDLNRQLQDLRFERETEGLKLRAQIESLSARAEVAALEPCCVQIHGVLDCLSVETLELYFELEKRSGGGDLDQTIIMRQWKMGWIRFVDPAVASRVLARDNLMVNNIKLTATPLTSLLIRSRPSHVTEKQLEDYFQDQAMASGGTLVKSHYDRASGGTFLHFNDNMVAAHILSRKHVLSMDVIHVVSAREVDVEEIKVQTKDIREDQEPRAEIETFIELRKELEMELETEQNVWQVAKRHYNREFLDIQEEYKVRLKERPGNDDAVKITVVGLDPSGGHDQLNKILGKVSKQLVLQGIEIRRHPISRDKMGEEIKKVQEIFDKSLYVRYSKVMGYVTIAGLSEEECLQAKARLVDALGISEAHKRKPSSGDEKGATGRTHEVPVEMVYERTHPEKDNCEMSVKRTHPTKPPPTSPRGHLASLPPKPINEMTLQNGLNVRLYEGDITKMDVDVIVNAANTMLMHGGGVARAISQAAGTRLVEECRQYIKANKYLPVCHVVATTAGDLNARHVLHAVGPRWDDYADRDKHKCSNDVFVTFSNILKYTEEKLQAKSLAIPGVSSGVFGVPRPIVAKAMYDAAVQFDQQTKNRHLKEVTFITIDPEMNSWLTVTCLEKGNIDPMKHINKPVPKSKATGMCKTQ